MKIKTLYKNKKVFYSFTAIAVLAVSFGVYRFIKNRKRLASMSEGALYYNSIFPLKYGSGINTKEMEAVKVLQNYLNDKTMPPYVYLEVDGKFGIKTETALQRIFNKSIITESDYELVKQNKPLN